MIIKLGVNIDHAATLREVRAGTTSYPNLLTLAYEAKKGGADQITIHLREDRRHIKDRDLKIMAKRCPLTLNLEMAGTSEMVKIARQYKPDWCCLVPEKRQELTTEGGLDVLGQHSRLKKIVKDLQQKKIKVSMFIDPDLLQVLASFDIGADAVEFHTGKWVLSKGRERKREWIELVKAAILAHQLGLKVHAGHGLDYSSTEEICQLPYLEELNIGHSIICYSLECGLKQVVRNFKRIMKS